MLLILAVSAIKRCAVDNNICGRSGVFTRNDACCCLIFKKGSRCVLQTAAVRRVRIV